MDIKKRENFTEIVSNILSSLSNDEKKEVLRFALEKEKKGIPISAFKSPLSGLEIITKFLRENEKKSFNDISYILNRKRSTLYNTYNKSKKKMKKYLDISDSSILIPFNIFSNRKFSILESIVNYLKVKEKLSLREISKLLYKNYSTVKTVYRRYNLKT